jgi:hypothetical protein
MRAIESRSSSDSAILGLGGRDSDRRNRNIDSDETYCPSARDAADREYLECLREYWQRHYTGNFIFRRNAV